MKSMFLCVSVLSYSLFLQSSDSKDFQLPFASIPIPTSDSPVKLYDYQDQIQRPPVHVYKPSFVSAVPAAESIENQTIYIPIESRCSKTDFFSLWVDSQGLDRYSKPAQGSFARQYDVLEKFEIPRGKVVQDGYNMVDPSIRFLYLAMAAEFKHDQVAQMHAANSGNVFLGRAPKFRSLDEFNRFQFRESGPKTLTVTKTGREILASLVVQYPAYSSLLAKFAQDKKIAPVCLEKMKEFASENHDIEKMVREGKYR